MRAVACFDHEEVWGGLDWRFCTAVLPNTVLHCQPSCKGACTGGCRQPAGSFPKRRCPSPSPADLEEGPPRPCATANPAQPPTGKAQPQTQNATAGRQRQRPGRGRPRDARHHHPRRARAGGGRGGRGGARAAAVLPRVSGWGGVLGVGAVAWCPWGASEVFRLGCGLLLLPIPPHARSRLASPKLASRAARPTNNPPPAKHERPQTWRTRCTPTTPTSTTPSTRPRSTGGWCGPLGGGRGRAGGPRGARLALARAGGGAGGARSWDARSTVNPHRRSNRSNG